MLGSEAITLKSKAPSTKTVIKLNADQSLHNEKPNTEKQLKQ